MASATRLSIDDFELLPDEVAEGHELVDGELVDVSGNTPKHNDIRDLLIELLRPFVREKRLGRVFAEQEYDFDGNAHGPDVTFFGPAKQHLLDPDKRVQRFVPDFAVEVVSPSDPFTKLLQKKDRYRRCGTSEVWIIEPASREVFVFSERGKYIFGEGDELTTDLLPGFRVTVASLFEF